MASAERSPRGGVRKEPNRRNRSSEGETTTDCRSNVVVVVIGDAGAMRNGDGQAAAHVGIRNSGITVETLGEVMIRIERHLVEACPRRKRENQLRASRSAEHGSRSAAVDTRRK